MSEDDGDDESDKLLEARDRRYLCLNSLTYELFIQHPRKVK